MSLICSRLVQTAIDRMLTCGKWARGTVASTVSHLGTVLNHAYRVGALPAAVRAKRLKSPSKTKIIPRHLHGAFLEGLAHNPELFVGTLLGLATGLRPKDKWMLRWGAIASETLPEVELTKDGVDVLATFSEVWFVEVERAAKSDKNQRVPLAPDVAQCVLRLRSLAADAARDSLVFPSCVDAIANPEHSPAATRRKRATRQQLVRLGLQATDYPKPCQSARKTCNEMLQSSRKGVGEFVLGHSVQGVNAQNYRDPNDLVRATVNAIRWPEIVRQFARGELP
jgi:integrase